MTGMDLRYGISGNNGAQPAGTEGGEKALVAFVVVFGISLYPIFSHDFISINDIYNHVAPAAVLARYGEIAAFKEYWIPNLRFVPYLGFDLVAGKLMSWFSLGWVVKLMVAASFLSLFGGAVLLSRVVHGRWSSLALISGIFLFNRMLLSGVVNYLFGVGLSLMGASAWMALRERGAIVRLTALCAVSRIASVNVVEKVRHSEAVI
jgi:hypothetical protein